MRKAVILAENKMQNTTEATVQAVERVHCESHSRHEMSKVTEGI